MKLCRVAPEDESAPTHTYTYSAFDRGKEATRQRKATKSLFRRPPTTAYAAHDCTGALTPSCLLHGRRLCRVYMPGEAVSAADGRSNSCAFRLPRPRHRNKTLPLTCLSYLLSFPSHCALSASCTQSLATRARLGVHSEKSSETGQK